LGLGAASSAGSSTSIGNTQRLSDIVGNGVRYSGRSSIISFAIIPKGTTNLSIWSDDVAQNDSIQIFTREGKHLAGTTITQNSDTSRPYWRSTVPDWGYPGDYFNQGNNIFDADDMNAEVLTEDNGFLPTATYDDRYLNGVGGEVGYIPQRPRNNFIYNGMTFEYSGDDNINYRDIERLDIDIVTEDLIFIMVGQGVFQMEASWDAMPLLDISSVGGGRGGENAISIQTQELAQQALGRIDEAILIKDRIRAHLGALQNRLENTVSNLQIQAENAQAAESRISDADVAVEMTEFVRTQILAEAATAMLAQTNYLPGNIAMDLISG
jgi:flagellin